MAKTFVYLLKVYANVSSCFAEERETSVEGIKSETGSMGELRQTNTPLYKGAGLLKPFSKDPIKQQRYEKYLELVKQGHKGWLIFCCLLLQICSALSDANSCHVVL